MKINIISTDNELRTALGQSVFVEEVSWTSSLEGIIHDVLVVSDREISINDLSLWCENHRSKKVFYLLSNDQNVQAQRNTLLICQARGISTIPPKLTVDQVVARILGEMFPEVAGNAEKVVTFFGADSKVGTTMIAQSCAEWIADHTDLRIGLLFLNGSSGEDYLPFSEGTIGLEELKIKLMNNILTPEELLQTFYRQRNLYVLQGAKNMIELRYYHPAHIERLLTLARSVLDVIIIDCGSDIQLGMTIGSLNATKCRYLVTTQQENAHRRFKNVEQILKLLQFTDDDFFLVVNKYLSHNSIYSGSQLAKMYQKQLAVTVPNLDQIGWQAEIDQKTLLQSSDEYRQQIDALCRFIAAQLQFIISSESRPEGWFKRFKERMRG